MKPTDEQIEAICVAIFDSDITMGRETSAAMRAWAVIAPMVLEEAAKLCNRVAMEYERRHEQHGALLCEDRIRALKGEP